MTPRLDAYRAKRNFDRTAEPTPDSAPATASTGRSFVVQKHAASRLHWDFRLEWDGVLLSWAVTRGPSTDPSAKRLAVRTEDHPLTYGTFEGTIPKPEYGAGTVMLWDRGTWAPLGDVQAGLADGMLKFVLAGERMAGAWVLVRMKPRAKDRGENWLLIKERDTHTTTDPEGLVTLHQTSIQTGRTMTQIAAGAKAKPDPTIKKKPPPRAKCPAFQPVQLAKLQTTVPQGDDWLHEVKVDGYRCLAAIGGTDVRLYTRNGLDWTAQFGSLRPAFHALPCTSALIDGEVIADGMETGAFSELQSRLKLGGALAFVAFDLLHLDGRDMTALPLLKRKEALESLLAETDPPLRYSTHIQGNGTEAWAKVCDAGREGLISKLASAPYHAGRHGSWIKLKCGQRQEFVIGGWSPSASRGRPVASLRMGSYENDRLVYRGRVGSGFGAREFDELLPLLTARSRVSSPFSILPDSPDARWITPDLVAEVKFTELTAEGHIRHGTYQGLRKDKPASSVRLETAIGEAEVTKPSTTAGTRIKSVVITHPERPIFDDPVITKAQLAEYYALAAPHALPFLRDRPLSLLRCPEGAAGQCFFQKHRSDGMHASIATIAISDASEDQDYITLSSAKGMLAAVQIGTIEFHICGSKNNALERPNRMVFDLDPDEGLPFSAVRSAALTLRERLDDLGLPSCAMLSGGKGIHVIVPLKPKAEWETVKLFSRTLAVMLSDAEPDRFIATMSKAKRKGLIFIDWLRNERGSTAIAPYSIRARPGAKAAVPVTWSELQMRNSAGSFDLHSTLKRLQYPCPLLACTKRGVVLDSKVMTKLERQIGG